MLLDANAKYSFFTQTQGKFPVSVSYYVNMAFDSRENVDGELFNIILKNSHYFKPTDRARKITEKLSLQ
jgi:hypothetical protein